MRLQHRIGERKNRSRARMKYLMKKLGADGFAKALDAEIARVEATRGDALRRETREYIAAHRIPKPRHAGARLPANGGGAGYAAWRATNVVAQRDRGYFLVTVTVPIGDYTTAQGRALAALARRLRQRHAPTVERAELPAALRQWRARRRGVPPPARDRPRRRRREPHHRRRLVPRRRLLQPRGHALDGHGGAHPSAPRRPRDCRRKRSASSTSRSAAARTPAGSITSATSASPA